MTDSATMLAVVDAYVAAFEAGDPDAAARLFAAGATVEDPVGASLVEGHEAIRDFYARSMATGAKVRLEGAVRTVAGHAVFPFSVLLTLDGRHARIDVIDTFRFDQDGLIAEMRAFWGPENYHAAEGA